MAYAKLHICMLLASALAATSIHAGEEAPKGKKADKERKKSGGSDNNRWERGFEFIKEHQKELNVSDEQNKKLEALKKELGEKFGKMKDDPEMKELYTELYKARQADDKEHVAEVNKKIRKAMEAKGVKPEAAMAEIGKILNREQLAKLAELRKQNGMEENPMKKLRQDLAEEKKDENRERPDPEKGAPSLYENEK